MKKDFFSTKRILYVLVSLFTFIYVLVGVDYEQSLLSVIMTIILGLFLTQWYLFVGLIKSREKNQKKNKIKKDEIEKIKKKEIKKNTDKLEKDELETEEKYSEEKDRGRKKIKELNSNLNYFKRRNDGSLLPIWQITLLSAIVTIYIISLGFLSDKTFGFNGSIVIFLYIMGPVVFLLIKGPFTMVLTILWIWFPIEWDLISDNIYIDIGLPFSALLGLFAFLWPAIMLGRHTPWFDWNITKSDLKPVNIAILALTIVIVPIGILLNFLKINFENFIGKNFGQSLGLILLTFTGIFLVQGIMEETLFRDIIMKHWYFKNKKLQESNSKKFNFKIFKKLKLDFGVISIILGGILIMSIPFWGPVMRFIANIIPAFERVSLIVGDLHRPLGDYEGIPIPAFVGMPVWPFYFFVGLLLMVGGIVLYKKTGDPMMAALAISAMIFGFAHFQDWRYVIFATFSGYGYGYAFYKTKNVAAAALVHMGVDAIWSLILAYP